MKVNEMDGLEEFDHRYTRVENAPNCPKCGGVMLYQDWPPNAVGFHCRPCERKQDIADIKARNPPQDWDRVIKIYLANTRPRTTEGQLKFRQSMETGIAAVVGSNNPTSEAKPA